jgi:hypothetical protein
MAESVTGRGVVQKVFRQRRRDPVPRGPLQLRRDPNVPQQDALSFLDFEHPIYRQWKDRWEQNERRLAGGDDVLDELRPFLWEQDMSPFGLYAKRQSEAVYTNFPDIYASAITAHLARFAPRPDQGFSIPSLGQIVGRSAKPSRAEQLWFSIDNPSGAGSEWTPWWLNEMKLATATGHRWIYVDTPAEAPRNREEERVLGLRPYLVDYSPLDAPNWYINQKGIIEFVVIRPYDEDPSVEKGSYNIRQNWTDRGYLLLVREGCTRLGPRFVGGGWWRFTANKGEVDQQA